MSKSIITSEGWAAVVHDGCPDKLMYIFDLLSLDYLHNEHGPALTLGELVIYALDGKLLTKGEWQHNMFQRRLNNLIKE